MSKVLHGTAGGNQLSTSADKTQVYGLSGNDTIISDKKVDALLIGGSGDDSLIMLGGKGTLAGGKGADTFELNYSATNPISAVIEDLDPAEDKIVVNFDGKFTFPPLSTVNGDDVVWSNGGNFNLTIKSVRENDYFDGEASDEAWDVLKLTNDEREKENLSWLTMSDGLTEGAQIRAGEIIGLADRGALSSHDRPDNKGGYSTIFDDVDKHYFNSGENLQAGAESSAEVMDAWIGSPSHYANIMNPVFLKLGVGYNYKDLSKNEYYWTQLFADSLKNPETISAENLSTVIPEMHTTRKFISLTRYDDIRNNDEYGATIDAKSGNDFITNSGLIASISGGKGKDTIDNSGAFVTINAGAGNDSIALHSTNNLIQYTIGDGSDTVSGLSSTDTLKISGYEYTPVTVGNDVIVSVGADSIKLVDAPETFTIDGTRSKLFLGTEGDDKLNNTVDGATIQALGGNDKITISGENVLLVHESGSDTVSGFNDTSTLKILGKNYSSVTSGKNVILTDAGANNSITILDGTKLNVTNIVDAEGKPLKIERTKNIVGTDNPDNLKNGSDDVTIQALGGDDTITNRGDGVSIDGGADNDSINNTGSDATITGGAGSDTIKNTGDNNSISGGADNDSIEISGDENTINAEGGDDFISIKGARNVIEYVAGGGSDVIEGFNKTSTLRISGDVYTSTTSDKDVVVTVGEQTISLVGAAKLDKINIVGTSQTDTVTPDYVDYNGHRYQLFDEGMTWEEAKAYCETLGGHLVVITSEDEQAAVQSLLESKGTKNSYWMGGFKGDNEKLITLTEGDDTYNNSVEGVTIQALGGNDTIYNQNMNVLIDANNGDDVIYNYGFNETIDGGFNTTILGGAGDDTVYNYEAGMVYVYRPDEGDDFISGFGILESLVIDGADFETEKSGSDVLVKVGKNTITLAGAAGLAQPNIVTSTSGINPVNIIRNHDSNTLINGLSSSNWIRNSANEVTITAGSSSDDIYNEGSNVVIKGGGGNDQIRSYADSVSIDGGADDDYIYNYGDGSSISGGDGDDTISSAVYGTLSSGLWNTINAGLGDDYISLGGGNNQIFYNAGDGSDTITGLTSTDTINILGTTYTRSTIDNDVVLAVGDESIVLENASYLSTINIVNDTSGVNIENSTSNTLITGTASDDSIQNGGYYGDNNNWHEGGSNVTINALGGDDEIENAGANVSINGGSGNDSVVNYGSSSIIEGSVGNDTIYNAGASSHVTVDGGEGDDYILNWGLYDFDGNEFSINGGDGNDTISNIGDLVTITGGAGDDSISLDSSASNNVINYTSGDGDDTITGFNDTSTLSISGAEYSTSTSGDDIIVYVNDGENVITLVGAASLASVNITSGSMLGETIDNSTSNTLITGTSGDDSIYNDENGDSVTIDGAAGNDIIRNGTISGGSEVSINGGSGSDSISNEGASATISGGAGDDSIYSDLRATIYGGAGNDTIKADAGYLDGGADDDIISLSWGIFVETSIIGGTGNDTIYDYITKGIDTGQRFKYELGDGNDVVYGFSDIDTLQIGDGTGSYSTLESGNDVIVTVGDGAITLKNVFATADTLNINSDSIELAEHKSYILTDENDYIQNIKDDVTIEGGTGNDTIYSEGDNSSLIGGAGDDSILNGDNNRGGGSSVTIDAGTGNDYIYSRDSISISGGAGNDTIYSEGGTVEGGSGNDYIDNSGLSSIIDAGEGNDSIQNWNDDFGNNSSITGGTGNDSVWNLGSDVTINGGAGDDTISLGSDASVNLIQYASGDGNDTIEGFNATSTLSISGAEYSTATSGNDIIVTVGEGSIRLIDAASFDAINIEGTLNSSSENGGSWQWVTGETWDYTNWGKNQPDNYDGSENRLMMNTEDSSWNDLAANGGSDDYWNSDLGKDNVGLICEWETIPNSKLIVLTENADDYGESMESGTTLKALGGNDNINNWRGDSVTIDLGADDDYILNHSSYVLIEGADGSDTVASWIDDDYSAYNTIRGGAGDDSIDNHGHHTLIEGNDGNDTLYNYVGDDGGIHQGYEANYSTVRGGRGNDQIDNQGNHVLIEGGTGNDTIANRNGAWFDDEAEYSTIYGGAGKDSIFNQGDFVSIDGGAGDDTINNEGSNVTISSGAGEDEIYNRGERVSISGGADADTIDNHGSNDTILGGAGNDRISLASDSKNNLIQYTDGDGKDTIWGATPDDTLNISDKGLIKGWTARKQGNDLLVVLHDAKGKLIEGSILLKGARNKPPKITLGESGSSGGTGGGMGGSGSGNGGNGGNGGSNSSGGTSGSSNSNSAASGGNSASGSSGISSATSSGGSGRGSRTIARQNSATVNQPVPTTRNQIIFNYQSGNKINSNEGHTGAFFDSTGNFYSGSTAGAIVIPDAMNKLIDLRDAAGNPFIKAYAASNAGVIDGRKLAGFEIINGSAGADEIYAGRNGAQMSGGYGNDTMTGGRGVDIFVSGKAQGNDLIRKASTLDKVKLTDVTLNDISSTRENGKTISLTFRTGNVINVEYEDILSPKFIFADGSSYLYNRASQSWRVMSQASTAQNVYAGGEQTISSYQSGDKILFNAEYRGGGYDGEGNFSVNSSAGTLVVKNAADKVIDLTNSAGNSFVKAYAASKSGVIDGRELSGYQIINGSSGADVICAGNGGSQLWGGAEADVLVGGAGVDTFITGRTQGADLINNAATADNINLSDSTLSDIVATSESNGMISLSFNTGNVVNVQSSEALSARFTLADGSAYRYNHAIRSWQSA